jgi:hypothetical protein
MALDTVFHADRQEGALIFLALMVLFGAQGMANAETMTWKFKSYHATVVDVQIYAPARNNVWPRNGQVWSLKDSNVQDVKIDCGRGEKVCYGAWVRGTESSYWGGGRNYKQSCSTCCYTCGSPKETPIIHLNR